MASAEFELQAARPGVRLRTLLTLRWAAICGQLIALALVGLYLDYPLPWVPALLLVGIAVALNVFLRLRFASITLVTGRQASLQFGFDLLQIAGLLYLSGGLENPFAMLMLVPVTISATLLSLRSTIFMTALAIGCLLFLARFHEPLPWGAEPLGLAPTYLLGLWIALALSMIFITAYAWRVSAEARRRARALAVSQAALERERRLSALGGLAAAAAHELGTPLGTITLIAKDLSDNQAPPPREDIELLNAQIARCREILEKLSQTSNGEDMHFRRISMPALLREAGRPHEASGVAIHYTAETDSIGEEAPIVGRRPELLHGLRNFIENATQYAASRVDIDLSWDDHSLYVVISDDGPGFDLDIMNQLGEPYLMSRKTAPRRKKAGLGLGVFIASSLLERTQASILFHNDTHGGAVVNITWPRTAIEEKGEAWDATRT